MNFNYVIINFPDGGFWGTNKDGYYKICLEDLEKYENVRIVNAPLDYSSKLIRLLYKIHTSAKINSIISLPFKSRWKDKYIKTDFKDIKPLCFIFLWFPPEEDLLFFRRKFHNAIFVRACRDIFASNSAYLKYYNSNIFDIWMSFDKGDCEKYSMKYFSEFESKIKIGKSPKQSYDVFFAGRAKDRMNKLMKVYDLITSYGLKCYFYLVDVQDNEKVIAEGIHYAKKMMSYRNMLEHSIASKCILEINQSGADGYTSRFLESVMYGRRLLTDNSSVKNTRFYDSGYIYYLDADMYVPKSFFEGAREVDYCYNEQFSPITFLNRVEEILKSTNS